MSSLNKILSNKDFIRKNSLFLSVILLFFIFINVSISGILFLLNISITVFNFILAILMTIRLGVFLGKKLEFSNRHILILFSLVTVITSLVVFVNSKTYDYSVDGNIYHKTAIGMMRYGWNPVKERAVDFAKSSKSPISGDQEYSQKDYRYENHYAKASWIFSANLYTITNNIESGHAINLITLLSLFFLVLYVSLLKIKTWAAFVLAFISILNPVSFSQLFVFYNDGLQGSLIFIMIISLMLIVGKSNFKQISWIPYFIYFISTVLLINIKFSGLMFAGFYSTSFFILILLSRSLRTKHLLKFFSVGIILLIYSILVIGFSPYVKNFIDKGHPLYPLAGEGKVDIMTENSPIEFINSKPPKAFIKSLFSRVGNHYKALTTERKVKLKIPLVVYNGEIEQSSGFDVRVSGNGVFFSGMFLLAVFILTARIYKDFIKKENRELSIILATIIPTIIMIFIIKELWWARYLPQLYAIIPWSILLLFSSKTKDYLRSFILGIVFSLALVNVSIASIGNLIHGFKAAPKELSVIKSKLQEKDEVIYKTTIAGLDGSLYNIIDISKKNKLKISKSSKPINEENYYKIIENILYLEK